ncbi:hypothetical protein Q4508_07355 [Amphritea sp. 2_MG-2023]|jgi:hypothetical protein|uniref:nucleoside recognition domain-containing protein n=1 Tax=Amphritea TaxID=515417 RepID=UPI001C07ACD8|nr:MULTISPECIES: nucleoside recognition domain-containing protein [Amphritea]MBU2967369.1 hypothetical protein [Amphritea atlantica]MDO6418376.1 hypothetical protein [Amphritea sp. 2_MG-2023]
MQRVLNSFIYQTLPQLAREIYEVCLLLFKLMIPILVVVKVLEEIGAIPYISRALEPVMQLVGLPDSMGLVWTTTLLTNIYGGMLIFFQLAPQENLTVAQVTVISTMMLIAHSLPLELRIVQKAGVKLMVALLIRILSALVLGALLHYSYSWGNWLQQPVVLMWQQPIIDDSLLSWGINQLQSFGMIILIITALMSLLRFLRWIHIERLMIWLLQPLLKLLGISTQATSLTIIGVTLGLSFGGGLLIREAQSGKISAKDCFSALCLLSLSHSIIEDTLLVMTLGADLSGVLWARLAFSFIFVAIMTRLLNQTSEHTQQRWLLHPVAKD